MNTQVKVLQTLIEDGLTFADAVSTFDRYLNPSDRELRKVAQESFHEDGELEIDDNAYVSSFRDDGEYEGAYVMAWVWVPKEEKKDAEEGKS